ncbi:MAG: hypothetical protein GC171_12950 [Terrimonas sp.]|nr:hypothetical protein [Terrimonas sp.]
MQRWKNIIFNLTVALNCMLLFLFLFESHLSIPPWLQVAGRMHPLVLHFPIVLLVGYAVMVLLVPARQTGAGDFQRVAGWLLLLTAFLSVVTAIMGLFLSREPGYDPDTLQWHQWGGILISIYTLLWYVFHHRINTRKPFTAFTAIIAFFIIVITGHLGAGITHGDNFLWAPVTPEKKQRVVSPEDAIVFADMVYPILETKCMTCHNSKKAKGELVMETRELLLKGGKNGKLWDSTEADLGLLLRRIHTPLEQKKHMPPKGKTQLTAEEMEVISAWIRRGADFDLKIASLPADDSLRLLAVKMLREAEIAEYDFEEPDAALVESLNTENRVVSLEALGSPALTVSFFNSRLFQSSQLTELEKVKKQIVTLDLAKMPLREEDIEVISHFENLRRLNLSFTGIRGTNLPALGRLKFLRTISLSGTGVTTPALEALKEIQGLITVYAWQVAASPDEIKAFSSRIPGIRFETGYNGDTTILKLNPPVFLNEEKFFTKVFPLQLKHYIQGTSIRYTTDGSEPDSLLSKTFGKKDSIHEEVLVRARAFKPGWISSDPVEMYFYKTTYTPDTVIYRQPADSSFPDENSQSLIDRIEGGTNYKSGSWVAFRKNRMECVLHFAEPVPASSVTLSSMVDIGKYIMPAEKIEIWGGEDPQQLRMLSRVKPEQPGQYMPFYLKAFTCHFKTTKLSYLKIIVLPVQRLPNWHKGKGEKGWFFIDEVLVN